MTTQIDGTTGNDLLTGTTGNDLILGYDGNDRLNGLAGDDTLDGGAGTNQIDAGEGDDTIVIDGTATNGALRVPATGIDGGAGVDTIRFAAASTNFHIAQVAGGALRVTDLTTGALTMATNVEHLQFSDIDLWLVPQTNAAPIVSGDVTVSALEGDASLTLDALANASDADAGTVLSVTGLAALPEGVTFDAASQSFVLDPTAAAFDALAAGEQMDIRIDYAVTDGIDTTAAAAVLTLVGTNDAAVVSGAATGAVSEDATLTAAGQLAVADVDHGEAGFVAVNGLSGTYGSLTMDATGAWTYSLDNASLAVQALGAGTVVSDVLTVQTIDGTSALVTVSIAGAAENNLILGTDAGDRLLGTSGDDDIYGLRGNDRINGRAGDDLLSGGDGGDKFIFAGRFGHDIVSDFDTARAGEAIDLSALSGAHGFADLVARHLTEVAGNAVITFAAGSITMDGVAAASLTANDFLF